MPKNYIKTGRLPATRTKQYVLWFKLQLLNSFSGRFFFFFLVFLAAILTYNSKDGPDEALNKPR